MERKILVVGIVLVCCFAVGAVLVICGRFQSQRLRAEAQVALRNARDAEREGHWDEGLRGYEKALAVLPDVPEAREGAQRAQAALAQRQEVAKKCARTRLRVQHKPCKRLRPLRLK